MNKTLVIYRSKTGFTERYARWISEALSCDLAAYGDRKQQSFDSYDTILFGGWIHAGRIQGVKWFLSQAPKLEGKKLAIFATGAAPAGSPGVSKAWEQNLTEEERDKIKTFYFQSGLSYERMGLPDRIMMSAFRAMLKKTEGDSEAYRMVQRSFDCASKDAILPLVEFCQES